jgi:cytochrome c peroxidase
MHDGAFRTLRDAILHHLDVVASVESYDPAKAGLPVDLAGPIGPTEPLLARLDPLVSTPHRLSSEQLGELVAFVGDGLLDARARPENLRRLVPKRVPSGRSTLRFEFSR